MVVPLLPDGVTAAPETLNLFVMVRIHVGQADLLHKSAREYAFSLN
jgi:hypothetical protein